MKRLNLKSFLQQFRTVTTIIPAALFMGLLWASTPSAFAQTETISYSFANNGVDGYQPYAALTLGAGGTVYGTTNLGGTHGYGTVFELTSHNIETPLVNFNTGATGGGTYPYFAGLVRDHAGNLFGTTSYGGAHNLGSVFVISPGGGETVLYSFGTNPNDGFYPYGGVVLDKAGNLYGTTSIGGTSNRGTVFKVSPAGDESILHNFGGGADGCNPDAGVVIGKKNDLYGTTPACGANNYGVVFEVTQNGVATTLHTFSSNGADGIIPYAGLMVDQSGNLYGTTYEGGTKGAGTVYKFTPAGVETILHNFSFTGTDGYYPQSAPILDTLGNFYGTTTYGNGNLGTVYEINAAGKYLILHQFQKDGTDGYHPYGGVIVVKNALYGTTLAGGAHDSGTVFKVVP
jgi:uncharacterized repeat protein (TIGR03803 family)